MARKRVLIMEDEAETRVLIREFLAMAGYELIEAADGTEGLATAERLRPDVILLDIGLRGIDAYRVCRSLKVDPKTSHIPVIFVVATEDPALNRLAFQAGAVACIRKPFCREAFVASIRVALTSAAHRAKPMAKDERDGP